MYDLKNALGPGGWIAVVALAVGFVVRLLKTNTLNDVLTRFGLPGVPKVALPWLALVFGFVAMTVEARIAGALTWQAAVAAGVMGILSGALAIAGHETVGATAARVSPAVGKAVFGKAPEPPAAANADTAKPNSIAA